MTKKTLAIVFAVSTILGTTSLAFNFIGSTSRSHEEPQAVVAMPTEPGPPASANQDIEVEVITATPVGFEPASITRARGPFILALHNRSGERELVLRLYRTSGEQLHEVRLISGSRRQHQRLDLPKGEYLISATDHPEWRCQLIIDR